MEKETYDNDVEIVEFQPSCNYNKESKVAPEIVEVEEENEGVINSDDNVSNYKKDVYVAVGKDDLEVLKWVLANVVVPGARVNLIHIFPPISYISTPVGRLWVGQLNPEQAKIYAIEEQYKRRNLMHKYIRLCDENKVNVDTILIESIETTKAILDLIPILNITSLVMGSKHLPYSRRLIKGSSKGTLVQKHAPDCCKVSLIYTGRKCVDNQGKMHHISSSFLPSSKDKPTKVAQQKYERQYMECTCFPVKFY